MKSWIIYISVIVLVIAVSYLLFFMNNQNNEHQLQELQITDKVEGEGQEVQNGDTVSVHYVGTLMDGTKFDSSRDRGAPFSFKVGEGRVIQGWEQGVIGMKTGGVRNLVIPPSLAYGNRSVGPIPANSTLEFEIELLNIE